MEKHEDRLHQRTNPSNQQPTEAGEEGAKSSQEFMFEAYGDKYATRSSEEGYGHAASEHCIYPFDKSVKGDVAEELGIPELKNRGVSEKAPNPPKAADQKPQRADQQQQG